MDLDIQRSKNSLKIVNNEYLSNQFPLPQIANKLIDRNGMGVNELMAEAEAVCRL